MLVTRKEQVLSLERLRELPIFPLEGGVLIPQGYLPLHVFEPRYRAMVDDCLAADGVMAVAYLGSSPETPCLCRRGPSVRAMAGVGVVEVHERLLDDRRLIVLRGLSRVRLLEELDVDKGYRVMRAEHVCCAEARRGSLADEMSVLRHLLGQLAELTPDRSAEPLIEACCCEGHIGRCVDLVGAIVIGDARVRQRVLEEVDVGRRIDYVSRELASLVASLGSQNGHDAN